MFRDLERDQKVFTGIAAHRLFSANVGYQGQTLTGEGLLVSGSYFPVLGLTPVQGRLILSGYLARTQLFGMLAYDPVVLGLAAIVLVVVALGAGLAPAIRASRVDPMRALRYE
ncbi:MAG TPA: hypothetical protein VES67_05940 [Vicinamibacterales bacterium]|nr:hypothetical protein [Vicinamibacterales bacterium]